MEVYYYTRKKCPLCEDGLLILQKLQREYPFKLIEKDIEKSDELTEKFGLMIPVVEIQGEIIQYGIIDPVTIDKRLREYGS
ncbi:glutaredoxin family protein [Siminovitchia sp. 179-K 8D1 HS]|uniref:glutaredoxin family protein n=1 Tax=Siminovitchia sp. 179-K 8D1 HS TaxID=3142385 RepID=UPI0039A12A2F